MEKYSNIMRFIKPLLFTIPFLHFLSLPVLCGESINTGSKSGLKNEGKVPSGSDELSPLLDELINDIDEESYKLEPQVSSSSIRGSVAKAGEKPKQEESSKGGQISHEQIFQNAQLLKLLKEIRTIGDITHLAALAVHIHFLEKLSETVTADFNSKQLLAEAIQKLKNKAPNLRSEIEVKSVLLAYMEIMGTKRVDTDLLGEKEDISKSDEKFQKLKKDITLEFDKFKEE
jgi:hypothetical protein